MENNPLPGVCSRVCEHPCESRCQRDQLDEPLSIRELKRCCVDAVLLKKDYKPEITRLEEINKKVAIVGGGPAGLSAAYFLARLGYSPSIYESAEKLGGMLRYAIPSYRLPLEVMEKEISNILDLGIEVHCNSVIGRNIKLSQLIEDYDAVCVAVGAQYDRKLDLENENLPNIIPGLKFLRDVSEGKNIKSSSEIIVIGGGNVAIDVARSAIRKGSKKVAICYRREEDDMPAYPEEIKQAKEEGIEFKFRLAPEKVLSTGGKATGLLFRVMKTGDYDKWGRRSFVPTQESVEVKADTIIVAIGQIMSAEFSAEFGEKLLGRGNLISANKETLVTVNEKVFAAGDAVTGPASVIGAIAQGKQAARNIDIKLSGKDRFIELAKLRKFEYAMKEPSNTDKMDREHPEELPAKKRKDSFAEVVQCMDNKTCAKESARCLRCDLSNK
jgi:NADPH-dependent glutamate synthase beta subunit-like oxidoreductase